jgi:ElaB/YqjD/DUF883 family membrane-anchored ribosome-binding protein
MITDPATTKPSNDKNIPENAKDSLDRRLDEAVEETFPTSDPVSVTITKGGAIDYDSPSPAAPASSGDASGAAGSLAARAKETLSDVAGTASEAARAGLDEGKRYVRRARERYPEVERTYREGTRAARRQAADNPLLTLLVGAGLGYALALLIHRSRSDEGEHIPDYARTRDRFPRNR